MAEVLVLVDSLDGKVKKPTLELLTAARQLGEPSAVVVGAPGTAEPRPPKAAGQIVKDEGDGGVKVAEFLAAQKLI